MGVKILGYNNTYFLNPYYILPKSFPEEVNLRPYHRGTQTAPRASHSSALSTLGFFETWRTIWENSEKLSNKLLCLVSTLKNKLVHFASHILKCWDILNRWPQKSLQFNIWRQMWALSRAGRQGTFVGCLGAGSQMASRYITSFRREPSTCLISSWHGGGGSWQTPFATWAASEGAFVRMGAAWELIVTVQGTAGGRMIRANLTFRSGSKMAFEGLFCYFKLSSHLPETWPLHWNERPG